MSGFYPQMGTLPPTYTPQHYNAPPPPPQSSSSASSTSSQSTRLTALQHLHAAAAAASNTYHHGPMKSHQSPWSSLMITCRPHPYHSEHPMSYNRELTSYPPQGSSSSTAGSDEDSMDKSDEEERITVEEQQVKKRNPYSIEELLKKPVKRTVTSPNMFFQAPCGLLVDKPCTCSLVVTSSSLPRESGIVPSLTPHDISHKTSVCSA